MVRIKNYGDFLSNQSPPINAIIDFLGFYFRREIFPWRRLCRQKAASEPILLEAERVRCNCHCSTPSELPMLSRCELSVSSPMAGAATVLGVRLRFAKAKDPFCVQKRPEIVV